MRALIIKEVRGFAGSLIGHITVVVFLLITGLFLWVFPDNLLDLATRTWPRCSSWRRGSSCSWCRR